MKLRIILILLTFSALAGVAAGGYIYYLSLKKSVRVECEEQTVRRAEDARARFSAFLSENRRSIKAMAGLAPLAEVAVNPTNDNMARANSTLDHFANALEAEACYLINRQGIVFASSNRNTPSSFMGNDLKFRPYFQKAMQGRADTYMAVGTTTGRRGVYYSHPVYKTGQDGPVAVAVIKSLPENVETEWQSQTHGMNDITIVVDENGMIFVSNHKEWLLHLLWPIGKDQIKTLAATGQFGKGPWKTTRMERVEKNMALSPKKIEYLMHETALPNHPGWRIIQFSNFLSIYERISGPLTKIARWSTLAVCLLIGGLLYGLYYKANSEIRLRQQAQEDLRLKHELLDTVLSASPIGICLLENRHIIWANDAFCKIFGMKHRKDYEGSSTLDFYSNKAEFDRVGQAVYGAISQGESAEIDTRMKRQDGSIFTAHLTARSTNLRPDVRQVICTISDITARIQAEEERVQKEKLQGVLETAGAVCHEQNQPLMAISGYCTLALMEATPDHPVHERLMSIQKAAERMAATTAKLMNITRYQTREYVDGTQIIDIDQSAAPTDET